MSWTWTTCLKFFLQDEFWNFWTWHSIPATFVLVWKVIDFQIFLALLKQLIFYKNINKQMAFSTSPWKSPTFNLPMDKSPNWHTMEVLVSFLTILYCFSRVSWARFSLSESSIHLILYTSPRNSGHVAHVQLTQVNPNCKQTTEYFFM